MSTGNPTPFENSTLSETDMTGYLQEYSGSTLVGVAIAFTILEILFVALRFTARHIGKIRLAADDILIIPSLIFCLAINAVAIAMVVHAGAGHHVQAVAQQNPSALILWAKLSVVESFLYLIAVVLPKLAILALYLRVFPTTPIKIICSILAILMVAGMIAGVFYGGLGSCRPLEYFWDKSIEGGYCVDIHALFLWPSFPNIITDLVMLVMPIPMVWNLRIALPVKIGVLITFLSGSFGLAASILRFTSFAATDPLNDVTWSAVSLVTWTIVEPGAYLIAACLPTLRPLLLQAWDAGRRMTSRARVEGKAGKGSERSERSDELPLPMAMGGDGRPVSLCSNGGDAHGDKSPEISHVDGSMFGDGEKYPGPS